MARSWIALQIGGSSIRSNGDPRRIGEISGNGRRGRGLDQVNRLNVRRGVKVRCPPVRCWGDVKSVRADRDRVIHGLGISIDR
jgi:hypothetical protein